MKLIFTLALCFFGLTGFAQNWEITPNYIKIPSVSTFPDSLAGRIVFKTPENKLYSYDGASWQPLAFLKQAGFSAQIKCCNDYPAYPTAVDLDNAEFTYGTGGFSADNDSYTVPSDGTYQVSASFTTTTSLYPPVYFFFAIYIYKNGNPIRTHIQSNLSSETNVTISSQHVIKLKAGDLIQMKIAHNYYATAIRANPAGSYFSMIKIY
jgi:hypothetical protein